MVVESFAHFVKSFPHFSDIHLRSPISHAFAPVVPDDVVAVVWLPALSNRARCWRTRSAKSSDDVSGAIPPMSVSTSLNCDVLLSTTITRSGSGSVSVAAGAVVFVVAVFWAVTVGIRDVDAPVVTLGRAVVDDTLGRADVVAASAQSVTKAIAKIEHFDKNLAVLFIVSYFNTLHAVSQNLHSSVAIARSFDVSHLPCIFFAHTLVIQDCDAEPLLQFARAFFNLFSRVV